MIKTEENSKETCDNIFIGVAGQLSIPARQDGVVGALGGPQGGTCYANDYGGGDHCTPGGVTKISGYHT